MATLISEPDLQTEFALLSETTGRLDSYIGQASRTLKQWVGATAYGEAIATTGDADRNAAFIFAETQLAMAFALPNLATAFNHRGALKSEKVEDDANLTYYTAAEIDRRVASLRETAKEATRFYWTAPDADTQQQTRVPLPKFESPQTATAPVFSRNLMSGRV
jgi:hypothetical protein